MEERVQDMSYETKVILSTLAERISLATTVKEAYQAIARAANTEGLKLPTYEEMQAEIEQARKE